MRLGKDFLNQNIPKTLKEIKQEVVDRCEGKYVIIGNTVEDMHNTYVGMRSGPEILYRSLKVLESGKHIVSIWQMVFLFLVYFVITLSILKNRSLFNFFGIKNKYHGAKLITDVLTFSTVLIGIHVFEHILGRASFSFTLPILFFTCLKLYKKVKI